MTKKYSSEVENESQNDELFVFLRILALLDQGESLTSVAKRLGMSSSTVSLLLNRIEQVFPQTPLLTRKAGAAGGTELTDYGTKLLATVFDAVERLRGQRSRLIVACSQSLVTNQIISPVIAEFLTGPVREQVNFRLRLETNLQYNQLLRLILEREVDLGIVWGAPQRIKRVSGIEVTVLEEHRFDLVFVSHNRTLIDQIDLILERTAEEGRRTLSDVRDTGKSERMVQLTKLLRRTSAVTLGRESQPLAEILPDPESFEGRSSIQVDTYDSCIAIVRSKVTSIALVPRIYRSIPRSRESGQIHFSKPIDGIPLLVLTPQLAGLSDPARILVNSLKRRLADIHQYRPDLLDVTTELPELQECRRLQFGYFIDVDPEQLQGKSPFPPFVWMWENIQWSHPAPSDDPSILKGASVNVNMDTYDVTGTISKGRFVITATRIREFDASEPPDASFVSTFTLVARNPLRLIGTWTSREADTPNVYAGVLSETPLELKDLLFLQEAVEYQSGLSADKDYHLSDQPKNTTVS